MTFADENQDPDDSARYEGNPKMPSEIYADEAVDTANTGQQDLPIEELTRNKKRIPKCKSSQL